MADLPLEIAPKRRESSGDHLRYDKLRTIFEPCTKCFERYPNILDCLDVKDLRTGASLLQGPTKSGIYEWHLTPPTVQIASSALFTTNWHHRLGHPSYSILQFISSFQFLNQMPFNYGEGEEYEQEEMSKLCDDCRYRVVVFPPSLTQKMEAGIEPTTGKPRSVAEQLAHLRHIGCLSIEQLIQSIAYFENEGLRADVWRELLQDDKVKFINTMFPPGSFSFNRV